MNIASGGTGIKLRKGLILLFLTWHFCGVMLWLSPDCALKQQLITPFIGYLNFFGVWQGWSVFEHPRTYNQYLTALVTYQDGTEKIWEFPRMEKMGVIEKMYSEGFRRWGNDCVSDINDAYLWPDATRYIARINKQDGNPPVSVAIIRHWTWIDPPDKAIDLPLRTTDDGEEVLVTSAISAKELE